MNQLSIIIAKDKIEELDTVNLTNCDREPIHIPNYIQPQGLLLALAEPDLRITRVSENAPEILGMPAIELLNRPLADFIGSDRDELIESIRGCLDYSFEHINPLNLSIASAEGLVCPFNGIVHRAPSGEIVLELEPVKVESKSDFFQFYRHIKVTLAKMQTTQNLAALCDLVVQEMRELTGFDRVMIYRFNEGGDGTVIAESKQDDLEAFLGMHYPDSDIPKQAKYLYTLNWLRLIPDVNYQQIGLVSNDETIEPLDMSYCGLRAVSPLHIEYLKNMGVVASMSVSLIQQQKLWGLIACHHLTPKLVPYEIRTVCEFLGQLMSTELSTKENNENLDYKLHLKTIQSQFVERLTKVTSSNFVEEIISDHEALLNLTGASGVAVCDGDDIILIGQTPNQGDVADLLPWLRHLFKQDIFVTDSLSNVYAIAEAYKNVVSGLLAMEISKTQRQYILWFRPEILQTVTWAGNPDKPNQIESDGSLTIFPRKSFEAWQQIVSGKSNHWLPCEVEAVIELRRAIIDIVLRQSGELSNINLELERINNELDAFAYIASHDLKEPLRGIHNYATFLLDDYGEILQGEGAEKLHTLVRLTTRMELLIESLLKFSRLGRQELQMDTIDLNLLLRNVTELFSMNPQWVNCKIRIPRSLPIVFGDRVLIEEVFTNLISNAFKYNNHTEKWAEISWIESYGKPYNIFTFYVRDNGIGIREKHLESVFRIFKRLHSSSKYGGGTGAGLTIVKKIVERHGGQVQVESIFGKGTTFSFALPIQNSGVPQ